MCWLFWLTLPAYWKNILFRLDLIFFASYDCVSVRLVVGISLYENTSINLTTSVMEGRHLELGVVTSKSVTSDPKKKLYTPMRPSFQLEPCRHLLELKAVNPFGQCNNN